MADRIICMSKGRIEQIGTADDLYHRPDSLFVAGLHRLAADQSSRRRGRERRPPRRRGQRCRSASAPPGKVTLGIRPEAVRLGEAGHAGKDR